MINRILIAGAGSIGHRHTKVIRKLLPAAEIRVFRHSGKTQLPFGADGLCANLDEILDFKPDVSLICTPAPFHVELATELARAGSHLLIEKPLSNNLDGVETLIKEVDDNSVTCWIGYNLRFSKSLVELKRNLDNGIIGQPLFVDATVGQFLPEWRPNADYRQTVSANEKLGGGVVLELSHELDYLTWLFGYPIWVSAVIDRTSDLEIDVEDTAKIIMQFDAGQNKRGVYGSVSMDFVRRNPTRWCSIVGSKGTIMWDGNQNTLDFFCGEQKKVINLFSAPFDVDQSYEAQWTNFCHAIENDANPTCRVNEAADVIKLVEAIKKSSQLENKRIYL